MTESIKLFLDTDRQSGCPVPPYTEITPEVARRILALAVGSYLPTQFEDDPDALKSVEDLRNKFQLSEIECLRATQDSLLKENLALRRTVTRQHREIECIKARVSATTSEDSRAQELATRQGWGRLGQTHLTNALDHIAQLTHIMEDVYGDVLRINIPHDLYLRICKALNKDIK